MELMDYAIPDEVKKQIGYIIREFRKIKFQECKNKYLIENNPYTKENFCENNQVCHYHTLTKLENDIIKEDYVYHILLKKLGFYYQVSREEHKKNMEYINSISNDLLYASEYIDDNLAIKIKNDIEQVNFNNDCIALLYKRLIEFSYSLQLLRKIEESTIDLMLKFIDFYEGVYKGLVYQCIGIYYLNKLYTNEAKIYFLKAKDIYEEHNVSKGIINSYLISVYVIINNYYNSIPLCNEMEEYYLQTNNKKRLMHVYNYLSDYYLLINSPVVAKEYFNKAIDIINNNQSLERFKYSLYYNWGLRCFREYHLEEALEYFRLGYEYCMFNTYRLQIINLILIIITKLKLDQNEYLKYYFEGEKYFGYGTEDHVLIFKYFKYKFENKKYCRRYAQEKIIPLLSNDKNRKDILLFFYEDLYKKSDF